jgi:peptide/nickel transport system substrate-binding protein
VVIMTGAEAATLDLQVESSNAPRIVAYDNVVEGLVGYDDEMKLIPLLATAWESVDATRTRFKLQQGVKFHNGETFNAAAVELAVKRMLDPALNSGLLSFIDTVKEAVKVDDYTVDIVTNGPDPILPRRMTFLGMLAPGALASNPQSAVDKPIGTGPYQLTEWTKAQRTLLTAFDGYWGPRKPTIKEAEFRPRVESAVRLTALKAGEAHLVENVSPEDAGTLPKEQVLSQFATECMVLRPNSLKGVTADVRVRQAMNLALDRELIVKEIMGGYALVPNGQLYIPSTFAYDTTMKDVYDLEKATALVKEAGAEGKEVHIIGISANRWLKDREIQEAFTAMINKTGLKVKLQLMEQGEWLKAGRDVENPPMDVWFTSAGNDLIDPDRILTAYVKTKGRLSLYSNPEADKLLDAQRAELNQEKRATMLKQIAKIVQDDAVVIPIAQQNWIYGISTKLTFKPLPNGQLPANRMTLS